MPRPSFLQIIKDQAEDVWCISSIAQFKDGFAFLILCKTKKEAEEIVSKIEQDILTYPTVDSSGFVDISEEYILLKNHGVKVFKPA